MSALHPLDELAAGARWQLTRHILPFWMNRTVDHARGGFVGRITGEGIVVPDAPKGSVLHARILWTFAAAARTLGDARYRPCADRAYAYLRDHFADARHGGVYWTVTASGAPLDTKKQVYAQAFALYGLAEYVRLTDSGEARRWAVELFETIEARAADALHGGYFEAFARDWQPLADVRLSEKDLAAPKSMNTHLHILEAYTNLYRVWPHARLADRLRALLTHYLDRIVDAETHRQHCFLTVDWQPVSDLISYGHDIEASWLLDEAATELGVPALQDRAAETAVAMARAVQAHGLDCDGGLLYEIEPGGHLDADKHWWPQAEAVVGFLNAYQRTGDASFLSSALGVWRFIERTMVDAEGGEWHYRVSREGVPYPGEDKAGIWKCPYHNARACLEVLHRVLVSVEARDAR